MPQIDVQNIIKDYRISYKKPGFLGSMTGLIKPKYKIKRAVNNISFSIEKGEMVGFIGPNGAGKSTTVKMLSGILHPTSGSIKVGGLIPFKNRKEHVKRIGVVFGQRTQLWWDLPITDTFELLKHVYKVPEKTFKQNIEKFYDLLGLGEFESQSVRQLSLGQRMRADIAAALLHDPEVIFFDEPTIGLDIVAKEKIREFIKQTNEEKGTTMLFTTHDMQDIEKTCNRMIIIDNGCKIYDGSINQIIKDYGKERTLAVEFNEKYKDISIPNVRTLNDSDNKKRFAFKKNEINVSSLISEITSKYNVSEISMSL